MRIRFYDRDCKEITLDEWTKKVVDASYRVVLVDTLTVADEHGPAIRVSTVWIGTDQSWEDNGDGSGNPQIFETMVFGGNLNGYARHWSNELDAITGHASVLEAVRDTL